MFELQEEIIKKINELDDVKKIKKVKEKLSNNKKYNDLVNKEITSNEELINIRKKLFEIEEFKEYQELYTRLKLEFLKINKIITSLVNEGGCNSLNH